MASLKYSKSTSDYDVLMNFSEQAQKSLSNLQQEYNTLETALLNTKNVDTSRRTSLRNKMNQNMKYQMQLTRTINAAYNVAATNELQARQNFAAQLTTISVLDLEIQNAVQNIAILNQDQIDKARMADINTNTSKENNAQMHLFKMV